MRALAVPGAVEQIVDNFVDNALEVAPAGSVVELDVSLAHDAVRGDEVVVRVSDRGPGLSAVDRGRAFDRFWRGAGGEPGGSGLGLAIVRTLADASGAQVVLLERDGGGLIAVVRLRAYA